MNLRSWLLARPDGRRRVDVLHLVLVSRTIVLANDKWIEVKGHFIWSHHDPLHDQYRTPWDLFETGDYCPEELEVLVGYLASCCRGFWVGFDDLELPPGRILSKYDFLDRFMWAMDRSCLSALPPDPPIEGQLWGAADGSEIQDFLGILEIALTG